MKKANKGTNVEKWYENSLNNFEFTGKVNRIIYDSEKAIKFSLETVRKTPKGNYAHSYLTCVAFGENELNEGDIITGAGYVTTNKYEDKKGNVSYNTEIIVEDYDNL